MDSSRERGAGSEGEGGSPIPPVTNKADRTMDSTLERELSELEGKLEAAAKIARKSAKCDDNILSCAEIKLHMMQDVFFAVSHQIKWAQTRSVLSRECSNVRNIAGTPRSP